MSRLGRVWGDHMGCGHGPVHDGRLHTTAICSRTSMSVKSYCTVRSPRDRFTVLSAPPVRCVNCYDLCTLPKHRAERSCLTSYSIRAIAVTLSQTRDRDV